MKICFATNNENKLREIQAIVGDSYQIVSLEDLGCKEELPETHETLEENSLEKATYIYSNYNTPCFADDTGLIVEALYGAPGVYSARYAGEPTDSEKNMEKLLHEMKNFENRSAKFKTVITFIDSQGKYIQFTGEVEGKITHEKSGQKGFGYDPIFCPEDSLQTFSEMELSEKNKLSHRARAVIQLTEHLNSL